MISADVADRFRVEKVALLHMHLDQLAQRKDDERINKAD